MDQKSTIIRTLFFSLVAIILVLTALSNPLHNASAQEQRDLSDLIFELNEQVKTEIGFFFTITLKMPPNEYLSVLDIGAEEEYIISEIGTDFICVVSPTEGISAITCIPFSNISTISFVNA